jgi:hypothetical protein
VSGADDCVGNSLAVNEKGGSVARVPGRAARLVRLPHRAR